jgi:hypothetical protein
MEKLTLQLETLLGLLFMETTALSKVSLLHSPYTATAKNKENGAYQLSN